MAYMSPRLFAVGGGRRQSSVRIRRQSGRFSVAAGRPQKEESARIMIIRPPLHDESMELSGLWKESCEASSVERLAVNRVSSR